MKPFFEFNFYKLATYKRSLILHNPFLFYFYLKPTQLLSKCLPLTLSVFINLLITQPFLPFNMGDPLNLSLVVYFDFGTRLTSTIQVNSQESLCFSLMRRYTHILTISFIYQSLFYFAYKMPGIKIIVHFL